MHNLTSCAYCLVGNPYLPQQHTSNSGWPCSRVMSNYFLWAYSAVHGTTCVCEPAIDLLAR